MKDALKILAGVAWLVLIACSVTLKLLDEDSSLFEAVTSI
jgi:hypothetical protein